MKIYIKSGNKLYNEKFHKLIKELIFEDKLLLGIDILHKTIIIFNNNLIFSINNFNVKLH